MNRCCVAIWQPAVIYGGRLNVLTETIAVLNDLGIKPDVLTGRMPGPPDAIVARYGRRVDYRLYRRPWVPGFQDASVLLFNRMLRRVARRYDLMINSSNSLAYLPPGTPVISYVHYPRETRVHETAADMHQPQRPCRPSRRWGRIVLRRLYERGRPSDVGRVVCNSQFTREALARHYPSTADAPVLYPPVAVRDGLTPTHERDPAVMTLGRFAPSKNQIGQIDLASRLGGVRLRVAGFAGPRNPYYDACCRRVELCGAVRDRVELHPDLSADAVTRMLTRSSYFLHTTIHEPFGITTVQAIARGCVPLVHDSGGQREVVDLPELRYGHLDEVPGMIAQLEAQGRAARRRLVEHLQARAVARFDTQVFRSRMRALLLDSLQAL